MIEAYISPLRRACVKKHERAAQGMRAPRHGVLVPLPVASAVASTCQGMKILWRLVIQ
jgi:hypothetical protein